MSIMVDRQDYDIRISSLPTVHGEKIVMRLSSKLNLTRNKKDLGLPPDEMERFNHMLASPFGIILVTGPTGSGKSTTLYTALSELNKEAVNIVTVEDPVEADIEGINQVQVNNKVDLNFASALRSILRQDPDIIMIGEIRDRETAAIAVQASITGHLVVSTLHTNNAVGTLNRMLLFVIPIFIDMFADLDVEMPGITMWVMNTSKWMTEHWYMILALIILVIVAYKMIYKTEQGRLAIDKVKMKMPLFGKLTVKTACAQFARTMSTLLSSGISTIDALETVSKIVNNIHYTNALLKAREEVMKGIPLSEPLTASKIFPPMVCHMTGIGEETGNIEDMLEKLADYYDEEVEMTTQSVLAAMEPLIIVFMAVVVGTLVVAVVSPIGAMYNGLDNL